jgi:multicomponent K+:H+ antiporter subunit G
VNAVPLWVEIMVSALLLVSGALSLVAALGLIRLKDFFQRMHPPALANTCGTWCVALGTIVYFSTLEGRFVLQAWVIVILLSITVPVTTVLLARAALHRKRQAGENVPPALGDVSQ